MQQTVPWRIPRRAAALEAACPRIILYAVGPALIAQCVAAAKGAEIELIEVKHLQAACASLKAGPATMLVVSTAVKWWDRAVIADHAAREAVPIRWVSDADLPELERDILHLATATARTRRLGTTRPSTRASHPGNPRPHR